MAVTETRHLEIVKNLGADEVIDYKKEDFTKTKGGYDFVLDAVGKSSFARCKSLLKTNGIYISTELGKGGSNVFGPLHPHFC